LVQQICRFARAAADGGVEVPGARPLRHVEIVSVLTPRLLRDARSSSSARIAGQRDVG